LLARADIELERENKWLQLIAVFMKSTIFLKF
jgi:hypothetical protein